VLPGTIAEPIRGGGGGGGGGAAAGGGGGPASGGGVIIEEEHAASRRRKERLANFALVDNFDIFLHSVTRVGRTRDLALF